MMAISLLPVFEWMESTPVGQAIRQSSSLIALVEIVHLIGMTLLLGTLLMVDLSLLGLGIGRAGPRKVIDTPAGKPSASSGSNRFGETPGHRL